MLALIEITAWHWAGFIGLILIFLALDLGVFHREAREVAFKEACGWTALWCSLSLMFCGLLYRYRTGEEAIEFLTGYIIELSLSMDNVFVIAMIFGYFKVPIRFQHRVLFWGIMGALVMRGVMIGIGAALISRFEWILYLLGAFLVVTGIKMLLSGDDGVEPDKNPLIRLARRYFPVASFFDGQKFFTTLDGKRALTPLALVLVMVETTDLIFAVDSIPAIFAITQDAFIVFTSNVFAILGLRSLYFVLAGAIAYFKYLKVGLSVVLIFIGLKMVARMFHFHISGNLSLGIVLMILVVSMAISLMTAGKKFHEDTEKP